MVEGTIGLKLFDGKIVQKLWEDITKFFGFKIVEKLWGGVVGKRQKGLLNAIPSSNLDVPASRPAGLGVQESPTVLIERVDPGPPYTMSNRALQMVPPLPLRLQACSQMLPGLAL